MNISCQNCNEDLNFELTCMADDMSAGVGYKTMTNKITIICPECGAKHSAYAHWTIDRIEDLEQIGWNCEPHEMPRYQSETLSAAERNRGLK